MGIRFNPMINGNSLGKDMLIMRAAHDILMKFIIQRELILHLARKAPKRELPHIVADRHPS